MSTALTTIPPRPFFTSGTLRQSWQDRLASWSPSLNPVLPRCRYCGLQPTTHREYCPGCGAPV